MIKILLLDCSQKIFSKLKGKGFEVSEGTLGFNSGKRNIPVALYEQDIIFYNLTDIRYIKALPVTKNEEDNNFYFQAIGDLSPGIRLDDITDFFKNGGVFVSFINPLPISFKQGCAVYNWIKETPYIFPTNDRVIKKTLDPTDEEKKPFKSLFRDFKPTIPVKCIISHYADYQYPKAFLRNARNEILSSYYINRGGGVIVTLPQFPDNDAVIYHFVTHTYFNLFKISPTVPKYLGLKKSIKILEFEKLLQEKFLVVEAAEKEIEKINEKIVEENNRVENIIRQDDTARIIMGYFEDMLEDREESWYPAFKITERLFLHYSGEDKAKKILELNLEINYIRRITNESFRDTRHSPRPSEVKEPPSEEEINKIIVYSNDLVKKYIDLIIQNS